MKQSNVSAGSEPRLAASFVFLARHQQRRRRKQPAEASPDSAANADNPQRQGSPPGQ